MTSNRIEEIIKRTAYPQSNSVLQALHQVWNEVQQECNKNKGSCRECKFSKITMQGSLYCCKLSGINEFYVKNDWYCADFKRRDE